MKRIRTWLAALIGLTSVTTATAAAPLTPEDKTSLTVDCIRPLVWGGFDRRDDIIEAAQTLLGEPLLSPTDSAWIENEIDRHIAEKRKAEATWPATTDWDRLDSVFKNLRSAGILALHNAGNTQSDAGEEWHRLGGPKSGLKGFIFYHGLDVEGVVKGKFFRT
jgi:hypothetical protein